MSSPSATPMTSPSGKNVKTSSSTRTISHYLHPDYLEPHIPLVDPKQSPLALLAETCNNIGKDITPSETMKKVASVSTTSGTATPTTDSFSYRKTMKSDSCPTKRMPLANNSDTTPLKVSTGKPWISHSVGNSPTPRDNSSGKSPIAFSHSPARSFSSKSPPGFQTNTSSNQTHRSHLHAVASPSMVHKPAVSQHSLSKSNLHKQAQALNSKLAAHIDAITASGVTSKPTPPLSSPSNFLPPSYIGYPPFSSSNLGPWASLLSAGLPISSNPAANLLNGVSHAPGTACNDPYCLSCHVTHRPCLCMQCMHQKLLTESYSFYKNMGLLGPNSPLPSNGHSATLHSPPELSPIPPSTNPASLMLGKNFSGTNETPSSGTTAEYCMYCGKHCSSQEDLLSHMQLHVKADSLLNQGHPPMIQHPATNSASMAAAASAANLTAFNFGMYPGLDLARKISLQRDPSSVGSSPNSFNRFHPFRPPLPSRLAANINYPFSTSLV